MQSLKKGLLAPLHADDRQRPILEAGKDSVPDRVEVLHEVALRGAPVGRAEGATIVGHEGERTVLELTFPDGEGRAVRTINVSSR